MLLYILGSSYTYLAHVFIHAWFTLVCYLVHACVLLGSRLYILGPRYLPICILRPRYLPRIPCTPPGYSNPHLLGTLTIPLASSPWSGHWEVCCVANDIALLMLHFPYSCFTAITHFALLFALYIYNPPSNGIVSVDKTHLKILLSPFSLISLSSPLATILR